MRLEVSEKHIGLRIALTAVAFVIAVVAFTYGVTRIGHKDPGYHNIEAKISSVITDSQGDLKTTRQQYPNQIGTDQWADTAIDFHTLTYNTGELTENEKQLFPDKYTNARYRRDGLSMIGTSFLIGIIATIFQYAFGLPLGILMARRRSGFHRQSRVCGADQCGL